MDIALSTHLYVNHRLTAALLERIWQAGIPKIEIFCARQHLDYRDKGQIRELGHWFRDAQLKLHSLHSPMYSDDCWGRTGPDATITITEPVKWKRIAMVDELKRSIEVAEEIPFRYLIMHLGVTGENFDDRKIDAAFGALEELRIFARQRGVELLLENTPNALSSAERLLYFLQVTHLDLGFCFDTGHANLMESVDTAFLLMRDRIRSTHVHDNDAQNDSHRFPLLHPGGTIDWRGAMELLRSRPSQWPLLLELKEDPELANPLDAVKRVFAGLQALPGESA